MLEIQALGLGVDQGIPTLLTAAATVNDVYAITLFTLSFTAIKAGNLTLLDLRFLVTLTMGTAALHLLHGFIEIVVGCVAGIILGLFRIN